MERRRELKNGWRGALAPSMFPSVTSHLIERLQLALGPGYDVERELGGGGMSHTFVALEKSLGRRVVVKVLPSGMGAHVSIERFRREIQFAARLAHPHIVPLLTVGEVDDLPFYTMPFVKGESLRTKLARDGELAVNDAVRVLRDVAAALAHAHAEGVVHRDIKPDNVILSGGVAVVTDFGVAKARDVAATPEEEPKDAAPWVTSLGMALGTLAYMSPEQATGDPHVDHRADIYSFGCMAYELFTGSAPFTQRSPQQILSAHVHEVPEPVDKRRPSIPFALAKLVMRCLEKRAADRPQSAEEVLAALDAMTTPTGTMPTASYRPAPVSRRPWVILTTVGVLLAVAMMVVIVRRPPRPFTLGNTTQLSAEPELELDAAISPDGRFVAYSAGIFGQMRIFVRQVEGGRKIEISGAVGGSHRWPSWSPDGARLAFMGADAIYVVAALGGAPDRAVEAPGHLLRTPAWSPDGLQLAYTDDRGLWVRALDGGEPRQLVETLAAHSPVWSPDGRRIAYVDENSTYITDIGNIAPSAIAVVPAAGGEVRQLTVRTRMHASPRWTPDGRGLLFVSDLGGARDIYQLALTSDARAIGEPMRLTTGLNAYSMSLSADATRLAYSVLLLRSNLWSAPVTRGGATPAAAARQVTAGGQVIESVDVSPDGAWLVYDSNRNGNQDIFSLPVAGGDPVQLTRDPADDFGPSWSPDGREIAFYSVRGGTRDVHVMDADGRNVRMATNGPGQDYFPDWSPDGRTIAFTGTAAQAAREVFTASRDASGAWSAPVQRTFGGNRTAAYQRWSPDGRWVAWAVNDGVALLDATMPAGPAAVRRLPAAVSEGIVRSVAWGRDATEVYYLTATGARPNEIRAMPTRGGASRLLMRLDGEGWVQRIQRFATDGTTLFFALATDEADVWVMTVAR